MPKRLLREDGLDSFRRDRLAPEAVLDMVQERSRVLLRLPVGAGKTFLARSLLADPGALQRYGLLIYLAPTMRLVDEMEQALVAVGRRVCVLRRRPAEDCGPLDAEWREYEARSCGAAGRNALCKVRCPRLSDCPWPTQMDGLDKVDVILASEQRFAYQRDLVRQITDRSGVPDPLLVVDEGWFASMAQEVELSAKDVRAFRTVASTTFVPGPRGAEVRIALEQLATSVLRVISSGETSKLATRSIPYSYHAGRLQEAGVSTPGFTYLGYLFDLLKASSPEEREVRDRSLFFIARPTLAEHTLILSANLPMEYLHLRLGRADFHSPFEDIRLLHSGSRLYNVTPASGAAGNFAKGYAATLDHFAALLLRNLRDGRSTLLVSRKKFKSLCADYLQRRLAGWGEEVQILHGDELDRLPGTPDPRVIPLIHYGVVGVNSFEAYESAYCLNSYYVSNETLYELLHEGALGQGRCPVETVKGNDNIRRPRRSGLVGDGDDVEYRAGLCLRKLEVDPAIQVAGRCRFTILPREVVFFAQHDLSEELGEVTAFDSLTGLRQHLGVPSARELDQAAKGKKALRMRAEGQTMGSIANEMGASRSGVYRWIKAAECPKTLLSTSIESFGTLQTPPGGADDVEGAG